MPPILVIGIAVVDAIARPVDAFPAPGGLRFFDQLTFTTGGCAVNVAIALAKLGIPCDLVARVGHDPLGDFVLSELSRHSVSTASIIKDSARPTSFSFVAVPSTGERSFLHTTGANATLAPADISPALITGKTHALLTGIMLMDALDGAPAAALLASLKSAGAATILDTVYVEGLPLEHWQSRIFPALPHLDYFIPSQPEALALSGDDDVPRAARAFQRRGARNVVIKLGAQGVFCLDNDGRETIVPAFKVPNVVDATGAGDCWTAGFLAGLTQGLPLPQAARLGNAVASLSVQAPGATAGIAGIDAVNARMLST